MYELDIHFFFLSVRILKLSEHRFHHIFLYSLELCNKSIRAVFAVVKVCLSGCAVLSCKTKCVIYSFSAISTIPASSTGLETLPRPARPPTSEEVQAKLAAHAESLRKQAQDAASMLNLPSYLNPSVVNPHQYAVQAQKRKLLWSGKKTAEVCPQVAYIV